MDENRRLEAVRVYSSQTHDLHTKAEQVTWNTAVILDFEDVFFLGAGGDVLHIQETILET